MKLLITILFILFNIAAYAEQNQSSQSSLSLRICIQKVVQHYPQLQKQKSKIEEVQALQAMAKSGYYPRLKGLTSVQNGNDPVYAFGTLLKQNQFTESDFNLNNLNEPDARTNFNFALEAELPIFNAFQTVTAVKIANDYLHSAVNTGGFLKTEAAYLAIEAYLSIRAVDQAIRVVEDVQSKVDIDLKQAKDLKEKGLVLGADYFSARVMADGIQQKKEQLLSQRKGLIKILFLLMGEDTNASFQFNEGKSICVEEKIDLDSWMDRSLEQRMDLKALQENIKASEKELYRERATLWPRIGAFGRVEENTEAWSDWGDNFLVGVRGTMDLYDPAYSARIKKAKHQLDEMKSEESGLKDLIKRSIIDASTDYETILTSRETIRSMIENANEAVDQVARLYQEGKKSIADLLEMRKAYLEAKINDQQYGVKTEMFYVKILFVSGLLNDEAIEQVINRNDV